MRLVCDKDELAMDGPFVEYVHTDELKGVWKKDKFIVIESKDTGDTEVTELYLMCANGHVKTINPNDVEW